MPLGRAPSHGKPVAGSGCSARNSDRRDVLRALDYDSARSRNFDSSPLERCPRARPRTLARHVRAETHARAVAGFAVGSVAMERAKPLPPPFAPGRSDGTVLVLDGH